MSRLSQLAPQPLWDIFANICAIPHPSYHEEALALYILEWAKKKYLFTERDQIGNILIRKKASEGYEHHHSVTIQAHLDMVPQKNNNIVHDFTKDPIYPWIDGEWVKARGTTLGADNGIGIASALAILDSKKIKHGPVEVLLTKTEEAGMKGAFSLQPNWLKSTILINTDSEEEGKIYIGCSGGVNVKTEIQLRREPVPTNYRILKIVLTGLKGGHSGKDIHLGLGNANKLLIRFLKDFCSTLEIHLLDFYGGTICNSIPREACAILALPYKKINIFRKKAFNYLRIIRKELEAIEEKILIDISFTKNSGLMLTKSCSNQLITLLHSMPNGVIRMSDNIKNVVETSLNNGVILMSINKAEIHHLIRSLIDSRKLQVEKILHTLGRLANATTFTENEYPEWKPDPRSVITHLASNIYQKLFNKIPNTCITHAGLECGLLKKHYPEIDILSIGPTIIAPHSPDEKVNIASVGQYWQLLTALLESIPKKNKTLFLS